MNRRSDDEVDDDDDDDDVEDDEDDDDGARCDRRLPRARRPRPRSSSPHNKEAVLGRGASLGGRYSRPSSAARTTLALGGKYVSTAGDDLGGGSLARSMRDRT